MNAWDEHAGFRVEDSHLIAVQLEPIVAEAERLAGEADGSRAGMRGVVAQSSLLAEVAERMRALVVPVLGERARLVRSLLFDKSPGANWDVAWHQDTTIAVASRADVPGFGPWSVKSGTHHVRPPARILGQMLTVRLNLDANTADNGPLVVAPGTHREGIVGESDTPRDFERIAVPCLTEAGGVVLMRPLLFHASRRACDSSHRRVLHLEYAGCSLPSPLDRAGEEYRPTATP